MKGGEHVQLAATSFLSMKDLGITQNLDVDNESEPFAKVFQGVSVRADDLPVNEHVDRAEPIIEKIKQLLEQIATGEGMKEELFNSLPLIHVEDPQLLIDLQVEEVVWNEAVTTVLEDHVQTDERIEEEKKEFIAQMIGEQLAIVLGGEHVSPRQTFEMPTYSSSLFHSLETRQRQVNEKEETITHTLRDVEAKVYELMQAIMHGTSNRHINVELTRLLEQAYKMNQELASIQVAEGETSEQTVKQPMLTFINDPESLEDIWNNLQVMYEKRATLTNGGTYVDQAKVRSSDVASWMSQLVNHANVMQPQHVPLQQQMTPVEQYVLHMNVQDGEGEQMMQQLRQIVSQSGLGKNDLFQQLSIQIQPEQLGDMKITLLKIDGELIAKITVHSQVAKHALESQMHQLKHLFSPHQVMIEKQEGIDQTSVEQDHEREDTDDDHEANEQEENSHHEEREESSFQEQFEQLLNERTGE